jgi:hypothetical protein
MTRSGSGGPVPGLHDEHGRNELQVELRLIHDGIVDRQFGKETHESRVIRRQRRA